ncbi:MAG: carbohydrate-binding protein [Deltaproteobacteria bacterium]|nr:carbohydrate-binding protein [Deltaproteobacteria bacterium]
MQARELMLDDDQLLLSSGHRLWNRELLHQPGLAGKFCYLHSSFCLKRLFDVQFFVDGDPVVIYDNQYRIDRSPSHTHIKYLVRPLEIDEYKYITDDDRAGCTYQARSSDHKAHQLAIEVLAGYVTMPNADPKPAYPLLGSGTFQHLPVFAYLDAPGFSQLHSSAIHLRRTLQLPSDGAPVRAQVSVSFEDRDRHGAAPAVPDDLLEQHQRTYNRWFADNVPYFDAPDPAFKKMWYYRWWLVRFNMAQADTPDLHGYRFYEGKLGFDNVISFAVPAQMKELTYLRDPEFGLQQAENSYRNISNGAVVDPPGSPYWGETYSHWIASAVAEFHRVHRIPSDRLRALLPAMAGDVRAWMHMYDRDGDYLPERQRPRVTGYDLDILSYWFFDGLKLDLDGEPPNLERVDFAAFVYANARAVAALAQETGDDTLALEFDTVAERIRQAVLQSLWDDTTHFFYPQRTPDHHRAPVRELHGFFPFATLLAPDEPRYLRALEKFVDPDEFWARFPPVITSQHHYRQWTWEMDGLTRNIAPHPISMGARTLLQVLKHYHQDIVTADHFMELMRRFTTLMYPGVNPYDALWRPNAHEYYSKWEPHQSTARPKPSEISHDFHSMYCSLVVEGVVGLTPRDDSKIELQPAALRWDHFLLDRLRYQGRDLTVVWDQPDGQLHYRGYPEGFSLHVDGHRVFTRDHLGHVIYDPASGAAEEVNGPSPRP